MELKSLKAKKFRKLDSSMMNQIKGGGVISTNARDVQTGQPVADRQYVTEIKNSHGVVTGYEYGCTEYLYNGTWYPSIKC
ncbi:hypothetical protein MUU74_12255 [Chryseobacterium daecheongense]|uniref:hypothetical protein n=1 Tax=Chryseobacterium daecheongense TaxID=192389 RepID=UPI001FD67D81|nr:hypothetical protein [Chryseobacterium daecheongense]UOU97264.1 hypothetical protein MUU74_12255 [Chryseobacterium daecheongense]